MTAHVLLRPGLVFGLLAAWLTWASAQNLAPIPAPTPALTPVQTPALAPALSSASAPAVAASLAQMTASIEPTAALVSTPVVAAPAVMAGCRPLSDQAMAKDLAAVTAQSKKADLAEQVKLFKEAIDLWTQAAVQCEGRPKERALRNREDDQQMLDRVAEKMDSGPQCAAAHKDASALQDIARQALTERRWSEAASLFRKAENMWDFASERCAGSQQQDANSRREQSAQDGHNAQFCAPLFEKAREHTQKLRSVAATLSKEDKQDAQMVAETLWRDALGQCKGSAVKDIASNNAQTLARERGTPWVARLAPVVQAPQVASAVSPLANAPVSGTPESAVTSTPVRSGAATALSLATPMPAKAPTSALPLSTPALSFVPITTPAVASAKATDSDALQPGDMSVGSTRFVGKFARDANATSISGTGRVTWATGDVFEGTLERGLRQGKGSIAWANGQRYDGDWVNDKPSGQGKVHFANGNDYEGKVIDATPQGLGHMRYASGDVFDGYFKDGEPEQSGVYVWRNGQRFDGAWKNGRPNGQGKLKFATGNQYEGTVVNGVPQGQGRMVFSGGEIYVGQFQDGEPDGEGTFTWPSGDQYAGQWKMGKKHGKGVFAWKTGDRWEGVYENDVQKN